MAEYRREDPKITEIYNDRLMEERMRRYSDISAIGVEHDLPRSYTAIEECKALAKVAFAGARIIRTERLTDTIALDAVTKLDVGEGIFPLAGNTSVIDGGVDEVSPTPVSNIVDQDRPENTVAEGSDDFITNRSPVSKSPKKRSPKGQSMKFARPANLKEMK